MRQMKTRVSVDVEGIVQGSSNLSLEGQSAAEFSSNPDQTGFPVHGNSWDFHHAHSKVETNEGSDFP